MHFLTSSLILMAISTVTPLTLDQRITYLEERLQKIEELLMPTSLSKPSVENSQEVQLSNLQKEVTTYMRATFSSASRRIELVVPLLEKMQEIMETHGSQLQTYGLFVVEQYILLEWFPEAKQSLNIYEKNMQGLSLPQEFYPLKLQLLEKIEERQRENQHYFSLQKLNDQHLVLKKDVTELATFGAQLNDFILPPWTQENKDFELLCQRLKEYKWARQPRRHVVIMNRQGQLLFSSLEGTQSLDCYQDAEGRRFFKEISNLGDYFQSKQVEGTEIKIRMGNKEISYILLYTYSPSHKLFIVVRIPKEIPPAK